MNAAPRSFLTVFVVVVSLSACGGGDDGGGPADDTSVQLDWSSPDQGAADVPPFDAGLDTPVDAAPEPSPEPVPDAVADGAGDASSAEVPGPGDAETAETTPVPECGDATCDFGESCATCPDDCGACPWCGDGDCNGDEVCGTCALDCGTCAPECGDGACNGDEACGTCALDCGACPACPDGACNGDESCASCAYDCGPCQPWCGDTSCNGDEDCATCPVDCGACSLDCGAGGCTPGETCDNCPADCGACPATLSFTPYWTETLSGPIVAGQKLRLRYDGDRLPNCRGWKYGVPAWSLLLYYSFDLAGPPAYVPMFEKSPVAGDLEPVEPVLDVPAGATDVWFWAINNDAFGCSEWDSDYGKNYHFPVFSAATVSQEVTWAGQVNFVRVTDGGYELLGDVDPAFYWASMGGSEVATYVQLEVYVSGVTDRAYADDNVTREVANTALLASRRSDAYPGGQPGAPLKLLPLEYLARAGNNFVYRWFPASLTYNVDPLHVPDGAYRYRYELATAQGANVTVLGKPGANDEYRVMVLAQTTACALFPYNPPAGWCP